MELSGQELPAKKLLHEVRRCRFKVANSGLKPFRDRKTTLLPPGTGPAALGDVTKSPDARKDQRGGDDGEAGPQDHFPIVGWGCWKLHGDAPGGNANTKASILDL